jgi:tRNA-Thr(GGU) m(6)t(6)A37 methyltransferase TsaA
MNDTIRFIGTIRSSLKTLDDCPLQEAEDAPEAEIEIFDDYSEGIKNLKDGAEIILLTWLHAADRSVIKCVTRRNYDSEPVGVFSTRSPERPNPIGLHTTKIISVTENKIKVSNLEVLDQTPLIDIKPSF